MCLFNQRALFVGEAEIVKVHQLVTFVGEVDVGIAILLGREGVGEFQVEGLLRVAG